MYKHPKPKTDPEIFDEVISERARAVVIPKATDLEKFKIVGRNGKVSNLSQLWDGQGVVLRICQEKWEVGKASWLDIHRSVQGGISTLAMGLVAWMLTQSDKICVVTCIDNKTAKYYKDVVSNMLDGKALQCKKDQILNIGNSFATFSTYEKVPKFIEGKPIHGLVCFDSDCLNQPEEEKFAKEIKFSLHRRPPCFAFHINKRELEGSPWPGSFFKVDI